MRVGVYDSTQPFTIVPNSPFQVLSGSAGTVLASLPAQSTVTVSYSLSTNQYHVTAFGLDRQQSDYITVHALDNSTIMQITSMSRTLSWLPGVNENTFRGSIEIRHSPTTGNTWAINILPMEQYLAGMAETSNSSPLEYLKAMAVSARTYAYYHYQKQTKHASEFFYVDSDYDQVYRGYEAEKLNPNLSKAVLATAGQVVTYTDPSTGQTQIAVTTYYTNSDGRTRSWDEVWGGTVPWLVSVPVPEDKGMALNGHGVGLSAHAALLMAGNEGKTYDQILHYFFTGVQIQTQY